MGDCSHCHSHNPAAARFCNQCGKPMQEAVAEPVTPSRQAAYAPPHLMQQVLRYRSAMEGERKRVTVLFADIKGSTKLALEAGAENWHRILDQFFGILARAVHGLEGTINQYTGDGIMALFGAPLSHEDHALRAGLAALEMRSQVRDFADRLRLREGLNLSMRVGINTGEVIVGRIGDDLRMDYTAQGLTVHLAARMEQLCEPGRIMVTRHTAALQEGYLSLRSLGETRVAGVDQALEVFELLGEGERKTRLSRSLAGGASSFVGRDAQLQRLRHFAVQVKAGNGAVVAVVGDAGMGKSRLCHEFANACEAEGFEVHAAAATAYASQSPMAIPRRWLASRLGLAPEMALAESRRRVRQMLSKASMDPCMVAFVEDFLQLAEPNALDPETVRNMHAPMLQQLAQHLPEGEAPQLLILEDLQFADAESQAFLPTLVAQLRQRQALLLINYRTQFRDTGVAALLDARLQLPPLDEAAMTQILHERLGTHASLAELCAPLIQRAAGNPFFVEEAISSLAESGYLRGVHGDYQLVRTMDRWPIADTVHALVSARLDRLADAQKQLLFAAAVIGPEFESSLLRQVCDTRLKVDRSLIELEAEGLIAASGSGYCFVQPLVQEIAYETQLQRARAQTHEALAQTLAQRLQIGGESSANAANVAHHWACAENWYEAGRWNLQAARSTVALDLRQSVEQYRLALKHLDRAAEQTADHQDEIRHLRVAARAGYIRMTPFWNLDPGSVHRAYQEALLLIDEHHQAEELAELWLSYSAARLHAGCADEAASLAQKAAEHCFRHGLADLVDRFRVQMLIAHLAVGEPQAGLEAVNRAGGIEWMARPIDADNYMSRGVRGLFLLWTGDLDRGAQELRQASNFADREGRTNSWLHAYLVELAWLGGEPMDVLAEGRRSMEQAKVVGSAYFRAIATRAMGLAWLMQDEPDQALLVLREGRRLVAEDGGVPQFEPNYLAVLGEALIAAGAVTEAASVLRRALMRAQRFGTKLWEVRASVAALALPASELRQWDLGQLLHRCETLIDETGAVSFIPWMLERRAAHVGDQTRRLSLLRQAAQSFERIGAAAHAQRLTGQFGDIGDAPANLG